MQNMTLSTLKGCLVYRCELQSYIVGLRGHVVQANLRVKGLDSIWLAGQRL